MSDSLSAVPHDPCPVAIYDLGVSVEGVVAHIASKRNAQDIAPLRQLIGEIAVRHDIVGGSVPNLHRRPRAVEGGKRRAHQITPLLCARFLVGLATRVNVACPQASTIPTRKGGCTGEGGTCRKHVGVRRY